MTPAAASLPGNAFAQGSAETVVQTVLDGRGGMPTFRSELNDEQIAAILTYVRSAWGNTASAVPTAMVAANRSRAKAEVSGQPPPPIRKVMNFRSILNAGEVSVPVAGSPPWKEFTKPWPWKPSTCIWPGSAP